MKDNVSRPSFGGITLDIKDRDITVARCRHAQVDVDEDLRIVECRACNAVLDPISVLLQFAIKERALKNKEDAVSRLNMEISRLRTEEKNIKSRIRYATKQEAKNETD